MSTPIQFPRAGRKAVAVVPERIFDPLNGWTLTVDLDLLERLRANGRRPSIVPLHDSEGALDVAAFCFIRAAFDEIHAEGQSFDEDWLRRAADDLIEKRRVAAKDDFYPRVLVAPDLRNGTARLNQRFITAVRYGSRCLPIIATDADEMEAQFRHAGAAGFFLPGSDSDYHPAHYGGEQFWPDEQYDRARDKLVRAMVDTAYRDDMPFFGICSGIQGLAVFSPHGYRLHQDLTELERARHFHGDQPPSLDNFQAARNTSIERAPHRKPPVKLHTKRYKAIHGVHIKQGTFLAALLGNQTKDYLVPVNSSHRQAIEENSVRAAEVSIEAVAEDGTIEALHDRAGRFILGVQFHPEALFLDNVEQQPLERKLYRRLFWAFEQAVLGRTWRQIIQPRAGGGNWRNRGMARVYMVPPDSIPKTPEFVTGHKENVLLP